MKSRKKPFFNGNPPPNVFIGARGDTLTTPALLAAKMSIQSYHIKNFKIDSNNNISCYIGRNYSLNTQAFYYDLVLTYYIDLGGRCTSFANSVFHNALNPVKRKTLVFPGLLTSGNSMLRGGGAGTRNNTNIACFPKLTPLGPTAAGDDLTFDWGTYYYNVYINTANQTNNAGGPDADLTSLTSTNILTFLKYSSNSDKPDVVTGLTATNIGHDNIDISWGAISHTNAIDYYIIFLNGNIVGITTGTTFNISFVEDLREVTKTPLLPNTEYNIKIMSIDEHGNNSDFTDELTVIIPNTYIGGVGATSVTSVDDYVAKTTGLVAADITNFEIDVNNNVRFNVDKTYTVNGNVGSWDGDTNIKYLIDLDGNITNLGPVALRTTSVTSLYVPGLTTMASSETRYCPINYTHHPNVTSLTSFIIANTSGVRWARLPVATTLGISSLRNLTELDRCYVPSGTSFYYDVTEVNPWISATNSPIAKIYVDISQETANGGGLPDGLDQAKNTYGWNLVFITGYTAPNAVTNLSSSSITATGCTLNFTAPSSTEPLDFYEVWVENIDLDDWHVDRVQGRYNAKQEISGTGSILSGLTTSTTYNVYIHACDIYWNRSSASNVIQVTTL